MQTARRTLLFTLALISLTVPMIVRAQSPLQFVAVTPCRLVDTRITGNPIQGGTQQDFAVQGNQGSCTGIPTSAAAYSLWIPTVGLLSVVRATPLDVKEQAPGSRAASGLLTTRRYGVASRNGRHPIRIPAFVGQQNCSYGVISHTTPPPRVPPPEAVP